MVCYSDLNTAHHTLSFGPTTYVESHATNLAWSQVITQKWRISIATTGIPSTQHGKRHTRRGDDGGLGHSFMESSPGTRRLSPHVKNVWCKYWSSLILMIVSPDHYWSRLSGQIQSGLCCPWSGKQYIRTNTSCLSFRVIRCLANGQKLSYVQNRHRPHDLLVVKPRMIQYHWLSGLIHGFNIGVVNPILQKLKSSRADNCY